jgi:hypothetical protein
MKIKSLIIFFLLVTSQVYGGWAKIGDNIDGHSFYIDHDRTRVHNGYLYVYILVDYLTPKVGDYSVEYYRQVDCNSFRFKTISFIFYKQPMGKGNGKVTDGFDWDSPAPGSINERIFETACNR